MDPHLHVLCLLVRREVLHAAQLAGEHPPPQAPAALGTPAFGLLHSQNP